METIIVAIIVAIALATILIACIMHQKNIYLEQVFAASYQLAGRLSMQTDDNVPDVERMDDFEFNAAISLLLDVLSEPNGRAAEELVKADAGESYESILLRADNMKTLYDGCDIEGCGCKEPDVHPIA